MINTLPLNNESNSKIYVKPGLIGSKQVYFGASDNIYKEAWQNADAKKLISKSLYSYFYGIDKQSYQRFIDLINANSFNKSDIFDGLKDFLIKNKLMDRVCQNAEELSNLRVSPYLHDLIKEATQNLDIKSDSYIDIGHGDGKVTKEIMEIFKINPKNVTGMEINKIKGQNSLPFQTIIYNENDPKAFNNKKCDLASLIAVLHHSQNPEKLIQRAYDMLNNGGYLICQEHDNASKANCLFHSFMDAMEYRIFNDQADFPITTNFRKLDEWKSLFENVGFKTSKIIEPQSDDPYGIFAIVLQKPSKLQTLQALIAKYIP